MRPCCLQIQPGILCGLTGYYPVTSLDRGDKSETYPDILFRKMSVEQKAVLVKNTT